MLFYSYFKTLVGKQITVELKNDLAISGTLMSVDQYLNIKLENTKVSEGRTGGLTLSHSNPPLSHRLNLSRRCVYLQPPKFPSNTTQGDLCDPLK